MTPKPVELTPDAVVTRAKERFDPLTFWLIRRILPGRVPFWVQSTILCLVFSLLVLGGTAITQESTRIILLLAVVSSAAALTILVSLETALRWFFRILEDDIAPNLPSATRAKLAAKFDASFSRPRQIIFVVVLAALTTALLGPAFIALEGRFTFVDGIAMLAISVATYDVIYFVLPLLDNVHLLEIRDAELYPLDPRSSPALQGSTAIVSHQLTVIAVSASVTIVGLLVVIPDLVVVPTLVIIIQLVVVAGVLFVIQQVGLSGIVSRRKAQTIAELQATLSEMYGRAATLTDEERKRFDYLLNLRDRLVKTGESALTLGTALRFLTPMLLPLISFLTSSGTISTLIGDMLSALLQSR